MTDDEFEKILADTTKTIDGDIVWHLDLQHRQRLRFEIGVISQHAMERSLYIVGYYNPKEPTLSYTLVSSDIGRIYSLDMGKKHRNRSDGQRFEGKHKHRWSETARDKMAYMPNDITAQISDPVAVWKEFCEEAHIHHNGRMRLPVMR